MTREKLDLVDKKLKEARLLERNIQEAKNFQNHLLSFGEGCIDIRLKKSFLCGSILLEGDFMEEMRVAILDTIDTQIKRMEKEWEALEI